MENEIDADESTGTSTTSKLGQCEVCVINQAKYTCPRCEVRTCCLKCLNIHKKELECDGSRDRAKFIPLNKFTNLDLSSDYQLLEQITRSVEGYKKDRRNFSNTKTNLPTHLFKLRNSSVARKTYLKFLPRNFDRHKRNTTRLNFQRDIIFWHIEWVFTNANVTVHDEQVRETEKICNVIQKFLSPSDNPVLQEKLKFYQAADLTGIRILLKAEQKPGKKFFELDPMLSLRENFKKKIIIEYPIIYVVLKDHATNMDIIDSDDELDECDLKLGDSVINSIIKNEENEESYVLSLKNLLFASDEDDEAE